MNAQLEQQEMKYDVNLLMTMLPECTLDYSILTYTKFNMKDYEFMRENYEVWELYRFFALQRVQGLAGIPAK